ncbi:Type 1 glutamine amidotransferase-like domain-containing protein [bacterium]|nr:Type 1 glutamine amidotransferase-like domain-containing protein [bacterium]
MKLYLSSYKFGGNPQQFPALFGDNKKIGLICNARDFSPEEEQLLKSQEELAGLLELDLQPEVIDLREYFGKEKDLKIRIEKLGGLWVRGGNVFVLALAFKKSGLDNILRNALRLKKDFVYGGFSAGICVLQKSLKGIEIVDDVTQTQVAYGEDAIWEGVGFFDYTLVPHFESDHPESAATNIEVEFYKKNGITYQTLRDGEVIITEIN